MILALSSKEQQAAREVNTYSNRRPNQLTTNLDAALSPAQQASLQEVNAPGNSPSMGSLVIGQMGVPSPSSGSKAPFLPPHPHTFPSLSSS